MGEYVDDMRARLRAAARTPPPAPWTTVTEGYGRPIGGLIGVGFAAGRTIDHDLLFVTSRQGRGVFDTATGERVARDDDDDHDLCEPDGPALTCPGIGPLDGHEVPVAGLFGGGLHATSGDGWTVDTVAPDWPDHRIVLSADSGAPWAEGGRWWVVHDVTYSELRAVGFSPSGRTLVIATSSDVWWATR